MSKKKALFSLLILGSIAVFALGLTSCGASNKTINPITGIEVEDGELPARPIVVSIPNAPDGAVPQSGIAEADIIYEFPVEGCLTRLQAVYYSQYPTYVGPIRSVRYYFVDLVREYQAASVGYGWGKKAHTYMHTSGRYHINGMQDYELFDRVDFKDAPNNAYISWDTIMNRANDEGWFEDTHVIESWRFRDEEWEKIKEKAQKTIDKKSDSTDEEDIKAVAEAKSMLNPETATTIHVESSGCDSKCVYDKENNCYKRYWYDEPYIDRETKEQLTFSNILVQYVDSKLMEDDETGEVDVKGRLEIDMQKGGKAMLFTNGEVIKGTWSKADPDSRTIFTDENGNQFAFSKGKTWCYIVDGNMSCEYK